MGAAIRSIQLQSVDIIHAGIIAAREALAVVAIPTLRLVVIKIY